ncbi:uncharacterized protein [Diadema antillarum]|uniref:uncharacterized protein n=1 Tax=Diadema antillarum TaxID=105358 RepID=UPI003A893622
MAKSGLQMKFTGSLSRLPPGGSRPNSRPPSAASSILFDEDITGNVIGVDKIDEETEQDGSGRMNLEDAERPASRPRVPREERVGIIGQYRKPWIRPHSTMGHITTLNERRRKMLSYRSGRPKSGPGALRSRSAAGGISDNAYSNRTSRSATSRSAGRKSSRASLPGVARKHSMVDSDVEEIVAVATPEVSAHPSRPGSPTPTEDVPLTPGRKDGWTGGPQASKDETSTSASEAKRIPSLVSTPRMCAISNEQRDHESGDEEGDLSKDVDDEGSDSQNCGPAVVVEPENENVEDRPRKTSVFDVTMMAAVSPAGFGGNRPRSRSTATTDSGRSSSPATESLGRRARKERIRRLAMQYENCRFNRPAESPRVKLRRVLKTVRVIAGICLALKSYVKEEETKQWSLHEMHLNLRADMEQNLAFDLIMFSKLRVTRGSEKLKTILAQRPEERTRPEIEVVLALLRKNKAFSEYQKETQLALAKVMEYQRFEPRRIVLKEGHVASGFYIVLSGTCLVNQTEIDPRNNEPFVRTITQLTGGQAFGEYSLLHDTVRSASVVCKDEVEVLLINQDDFDEIIKQPMEQKRDELIDFCNKHDIYISASPEVIANQPKSIYSKFFKPGLLITNDIMASEYIYVVKGGKCSVVAEIKELKGQGKKGQLHERFTMDDEAWKKDAAIKRSMAVLAIKAGGKRRNWASVAKKTAASIPETMTVDKNIFKSGAMSLKDADAEYAKERKMSLKLTFQEPSKFLLKDDKLITTKKKEPEPKRDPSALIRTWKRVTATANALSQKEEVKDPVQTAPPSKVKTTFAQLAILKTGMAFGIESLLPGTQPEAKLSLISDGADIILVSKRLFASDVTSTTLKMASKMAVDYPSVDFTRGVMEEARTWASYKNNIVKEIYGKKLDKRPVLPRR